MERLAELIIGRRALVALLIVVVTGISAFGLSRLEFDDLPRGIYESDDERFTELERVQREFGADDNDCVVVLEAESFFTSGSARALRELHRALAAVSGVERSIGLVDVLTFDARGLMPRPLLPGDGASPEEFARAEKNARTHPLVAGHILSPDAKTTLVIARFAGDEPSIHDIQPTLAGVSDALARWRSTTNIRARLTGIPPIRVRVYELVRSDTAFFLPAGVITCSLIALVAFRRATALLASAAGPIAGTLWTLGLFGLVGVKVDILGMILPSLVLTIGFTDAVHLVMDMRHSRADGKDPVEAARDAIRHLGMPCFLTSITTAIGFASLAVGDVGLVVKFGLSSAAGVLITFVAVISIVPSIGSALRDLGEAREVSRRERRATVGARASTGLIGWVIDHARLVTAGGISILALLLAASLEVEPDNMLQEAMPTGDDAVEALLHCDEVFGGILPAYVVVDWEEGLSLPTVVEATRKAEAAIREDDLFPEPLSLADLVDSLPGKSTAILPSLPPDLLQRFIRLDRRRTIVTTNLPDRRSHELAPSLDALQSRIEKLSALDDGIEFSLTGTNLVARDNINDMIADLASGLAIAAVVIFVVLTLELRSLRLGLLSLLPNVFPLVTVGAFLFLIDEPLRLSSAVIFTILLGIAVDDTIHVLARYRRELGSSSDTDQALGRTFMAVGRTLVMTTTIFVGGSTCVLFSSMPTNRTFGKLMVIGLVAALVADLILLPALLVCFRGRREA